MGNINKTPLFKTGENVRFTSNGKIGTINDIIEKKNSFGYHVTLEGKKYTVQEKHLSKMETEDRIFDSFSSGTKGNKEDFQLFQTWFRLKRPVEGNFYSYLASKTVFNPYQFKPLSKFISPGSDSRLFIADEVGVGKTIETGIILTELLARGKIDRKSPVLIVCPNSLLPKWEKEMRKRFNLHFHIHDGKSLKNFFKSAKDGNIPDGMIWSLVSLSLLRTEKHYSNLRELHENREIPLWSLVVVDESHHMRNSSTYSYQTGKYLSDLTEMMVMLSATPLNLKDEDLFSQMHILNSRLFPDLQSFSNILSPLKNINICRRLLLQDTEESRAEVCGILRNLKTGATGEAISGHPGIKKLEERLSSEKPLSAEETAHYDRVLGNLSPIDNSFTRTLKREAFEHRVTREPIKVPVKLSPAEKDFHDEIIELTKDLYLDKGGEPSAIGFVTNVPRRMAGSCLPAMKEYLDWCIENNSVYDLKPSEDEPDDDLAFGEMAISQDIKDRFIQLRNDARKISGLDTKYDEFLKLIGKLQAESENPQIVVFSFFVRTLKYLEKRLKEDGYRVGLIYGDTPNSGDGQAQSRYEIMEAFERGEFEVLLSSEVGGEGVDFQFCQSIINYDLPYNPMRIEQRIGRVDRFGQKADKIFVACMYIHDSIDENIYDTLYVRINLIQDSIGALEPILGNTLADLNNDIIQGSFTDKQIQERIRTMEIAVENSRIEMEKYEQNRKELLGEDHFNSIIQKPSMSTEFVQPVDALWLTDRCLSSWDGCEFKQTDSDSGKIRLSKAVMSELEDFRRRPGSEGCEDELGRISESKGFTEVVFNGMAATQRMNAVFLPPCGFWIKFLLYKLEMSENIPCSFSLSLESSDAGISPGDYSVLFYEVTLEGFSREINLMAVPVDIQTMQVPKCDFRKFSRLLKEYSVSCEDYYTDFDIEEVSDTAEDALESFMEVEISEMEAENSYRIQSYVNSVEKSAESQTTAVDRKIQEHCEKRIRDNQEPNEKFLRLMQYQKDNIKKRSENRIKQLRAKDGLFMGKDLVAVSVLKVI
ncbi:DEAD/DEAH box helicase [Methanoplanus endosymbiosus]|uniref:DEAD/DEAH box helicase n=1 Tax=Methanoplanus endosymbiosus TaxID=33865 RepID=A0A9E7PMX2_9EURY|nr:DEAD/DEAH box helicase [Methanoplanus endosymbiosus]UUX93188.1 DEAD/DEAH box helicase [Methanoplanus endosymbiosus]